MLTLTRRHFCSRLFYFTSLPSFIVCLVVLTLCSHTDPCSPLFLRFHPFLHLAALHRFVAAQLPRKQRHPIQLLQRWISPCRCIQGARSHQNKPHLHLNHIQLHLNYYYNNHTHVLLARNAQGWIFRSKGIKKKTPSTIIYN